MTIAAGTVTNPEAGVIVANPATIPDATPNTLGRPFKIHSVTPQLSAAAAAEKWVAAKALVANPPAPNALPALNPNQPTHNNPAPSKVNTTLCGGIGSCGKPIRFPRTTAHTNAEKPELICTTVPPAKSSTGIFPPSAQLNIPPLPQTMCASGK